MSITNNTQRQPQVYRQQSRSTQARSSSRDTVTHQSENSWIRDGVEMFSQRGQDAMQQLYDTDYRHSAEDGRREQAVFKEATKHLDSPAYDDWSGEEIEQEKRKVIDGLKKKRTRSFVTEVDRMMDNDYDAMIQGSEAARVQKKKLQADFNQLRNVVAFGLRDKGFYGLKEEMNQFARSNPNYSMDAVYETAHKSLLKSGNVDAINEALVDEHYPEYLKEDLRASLGDVKASNELERERKRLKGQKEVFRIHAALRKHNGGVVSLFELKDYMLNYSQFFQDPENGEVASEIRGDMDKFWTEGQAISAFSDSIRKSPWRHTQADLEKAEKQAADAPNHMGRVLSAEQITEARRRGNILPSSDSFKSFFRLISDDVKNVEADKQDIVKIIKQTKDLNFLPSSVVKGDEGLFIDALISAHGDDLLSSDKAISDNALLAVQAKAQRFAEMGSKFQIKVTPKDTVKVLKAAFKEADQYGLKFWDVPPDMDDPEHFTLLTHLSKVLNMEANINNVADIDGQKKIVASSLNKLVTNLDGDLFPNSYFTTDNMTLRQQQAKQVNTLIRQGKIDILNVKGNEFLKERGIKPKDIIHSIQADGIYFSSPDGTTLAVPTLVKANGEKQQGEWARIPTSSIRAELVKQFTQGSAEEQLDAAKRAEGEQAILNSL